MTFEWDSVGGVTVDILVLLFSYFEPWLYYVAMTGVELANVNQTVPKLAVILLSRLLGYVRVSLHLAILFITIEMYSYDYGTTKAEA